MVITWSGWTYSWSSVCVCVSVCVCGCVCVDVCVTRPWFFFLLQLQKNGAKTFKSSCALKITAHGVPPLLSLSLKGGTYTCCQLKSGKCQHSVKQRRHEHHLEVRTDHLIISGMCHKANRAAVSLLSCLKLFILSVVVKYKWGTVNAANRMTG